VEHVPSTRLTEARNLSRDLDVIPSRDCDVIPSRDRDVIVSSGDVWRSVSDTRRASGCSKAPVHSSSTTDCVPWKGDALRPVAFGVGFSFFKRLRS
jgi:hypothetical protein